MSHKDEQPVEGEVVEQPTAQVVDEPSQELVTSEDEPRDILDLFEPKQIELIKRTVAKGTTDDELRMFLHIAKKANLDPFLKEIWCYKDGKDNTIMFAGRDGFKRVAESSGFFGGLKSGAVHENDEFSIDLMSGEVKHTITSPAARGPLIGAWAIAYRTDRKEPAVEYVEFATYNKGWNTWKSHPDEMIRKVAEVHVLKTQFVINGVYSEEERASIIAQSEAGLLNAADDTNDDGTPEVESTEWRDKLAKKVMEQSNGEATPQEVWPTISDQPYPETEEEAQTAYASLLKTTNAQ